MAWQLPSVVKAGNPYAPHAIARSYACLEELEAHARVWDRRAARRGGGREPRRDEVLVKPEEDEVAVYLSCEDTCNPYAPCHR